MSQHTAEVVPVVLNRVENSDNLSWVQVFGWTVVCRTEDWIGKDRGVYIPPDEIVKTDKPEFAFLNKEAKDGKYRIPQEK